MPSLPPITIHDCTVFAVDSLSSVGSKVSHQLNPSSEQSSSPAEDAFPAPDQEVQPAVPVRRWVCLSVWVSPPTSQD